jgi:hypothetical protein
VLRLACLAALALVAGCGGGDGAGEPEEAVREFVKATNARDGDKLCGELLTQAYLERSTLATGDRAEQACKKQLDLITGLKLRLVSIEKAQVDGDRATVRATIVTQGRRLPRTFGLIKEDGDWKLNSGS